MSHRSVSKHLPPLTRRVLLWIRHHVVIAALLVILACLVTLQLSINVSVTRNYNVGQLIRNLYVNRPKAAASSMDQSALETLYGLLGYQPPSLSPCPFPPPGLVGVISVTYESLSWRELDSRHPQVAPGGLWRPSNCSARHRVAIIVPYRDRSDHLRVFLNHIHPYLQKQLIQYSIYVVEQDPYSPFNRGLLLNIGYREALADAAYDCVIFHDVDLLPENDKNFYYCPEQPRHMSVAVDEFAYRLPYDSLFGGVEAFSKDHFELINGFSNMYFGWGAEDDDLYERLQFHGLNLTRYPRNIARYSMVRHLKSDPNPGRFKHLKDSKERFNTDGLNTLIYDRKRFERRKLFTWIYARVNQTAIMESVDVVSSPLIRTAPAIPP